MNIADQFKQIRIFLTQNRFIRVLKQVPMTAVPAIVADGISGQKPPHDTCQKHFAGPEEQMIWDQCPSITRRIGLLQDFAQPVNKIIQSASS